MMMKNWTNIILCFFLSLQILQAQGWEKTYPVNETAFHLAEHNDDGYLVMGNDKLNHINNEGESQWASTIGGRYIISLADGNYLIAGNPNANVELTKIDGSGQVIFSNNMNNTFSHYLRGIVELSNGDFAIVGIENESMPSDGNLFVMRTDSEGNLISETIISGYFQTGGLSGNLVLDENENLVMTSRRKEEINGLITDIEVILKADINGQVIWSHDIYDTAGSGLDIIQGLVKTANGEYVINHLETVPSNNNLPDTKLHVVRFDTDGNLLWDNDYLAIPNQSDAALYSWQYYVTGRGITSLADGGTISTAMDRDASTATIAGTINMMVYKVDADGNTVWERSVGVPGASDYIYDVMEDSDGNILLCGSRGGQCFVAKMDANGYIYSNVITGSVAEDANENCLVESGESPYESWVVEAVGSSSFYALTDENGNYELRVDSGSYVINVVPPNPYFTSCINNELIAYPGFYNSDVIDFPITENADCPYMVVDIGTPFLRRCFDNTYYVNYCNSGTSDSEDTYIEIDFDEYLSVNNASIPFTVVNDTYVFDVGTVAENDCGSFTVSVFVDCDSTVLGQTHCTEARIFPDSICVPPNPLWSGASLDLTASCNNGNITFTTTNVGSGNMVSNLNYFVIEDQIVMLTGSEDPLPMGDNNVLEIPATGGTFRLEVEQIPGHPNPQMPSITIEGCTSDTSESFSLGFLTMYSENDGSPSVSIDCQENIGSYDPNDKLAYPKGYEEEHFIEANTDIEYRIRFQNTGTDTAFLVTIIDTLSEFLNPATVRPGASSHPYDFSMDGNGVMKFTFNNIMLADSNTNEPASHGFVKFKISQRADNPIGTMIHNEADIYFDSNLPVRTNDAWHTIGDDFIMVSADDIPDSYVQIKNYPNPFVTQTTFEISGEEYSDIILRLHDVTGRTLRQEEFDGSILNFQRGNLTTGLHFYEIVGDGKLIGSGRFVVQ